VIFFAGAFLATGAFFFGGGAFFGAPKGLGFGRLVLGKFSVGAFLTDCGFAFGSLAAGFLGAPELPPNKDRAGAFLTGCGFAFSLLAAGFSGAPEPPPPNKDRVGAFFTGAGAAFVLLAAGFLDAPELPPNKDRAGAFLAGAGFAFGLLAAGFSGAPEPPPPNKDRVGAFFTGAGVAFGLLLAAGSGASAGESLLPPNILNREKVSLGESPVPLLSSIAFLWLLRVMVGDDPVILANRDGTLVGGSAERKYREPVDVVTVPPFSTFPPAIVVVSMYSPSSKFGEL